MDSVVRVQTIAGQVGPQRSSMGIRIPARSRSSALLQVSQFDASKKIWRIDLRS